MRFWRLEYPPPEDLCLLFFFQNGTTDSVQKGERHRMWCVIVRIPQNCNGLRKFKPGSGQNRHCQPSFKVDFFGLFFSMKKFQICSRGVHHVFLAVSTCNNKRTTEDIFMAFWEWKMLLKILQTMQFWFMSHNSNVHFAWRFACSLALIWNVACQNYLSGGKNIFG